MKFFFHRVTMTSFWWSLLSLIILSGCMTVHVNLVYLPQEPGKSPLGTLKPMEVTIQIRDQRHQEDERLVGIQESWAARWKIKASEKITTVLYDAVRRELQDNGHRVVDAKDPAEWVIQVGLRKYWSDAARDRIWDRIWTADMVATIVADITIRDERNDSTILTKPIESVFIVYNYAWRRMPGMVATAMLSFGIAGDTPPESVSNRDGYL